MRSGAPVAWAGSPRFPPVMTELHRRPPSPDPSDPTSSRRGDMVGLYLLVALIVLGVVVVGLSFARM